MQRLFILLSIFILSVTQLIGQTHEELFNKIAQLDSTFFVSFNNCDLETYGSFLSENFEFYHDKQGMTKSREAELESMKVFCGEQREQQQLRRELIKESLKVFRMNDYGAIATGEHKFYLVIDEQTSKSVTKAKFTTLWKFEDDEWKMTRTLSYDHQPEPEYKTHDKDLKIFEGNYQAPDRIVNIRSEATILRMTDIVDNKEVWSAELLPESENLFYLNFQNIQVEFIRTGTEISKFVVYENGKQIEESTRIE
jgi:hypothetical protein